MHQNFVLPQKILVALLRFLILPNFSIAAMKILILPKFLRLAGQFSPAPGQVRLCFCGKKPTLNSFQLLIIFEEKRG